MADTNYYTNYINALDLEILYYCIISLIDFSVLGIIGFYQKRRLGSHTEKVIVLSMIYTAMIFCACDFLYESLYYVLIHGMKVNTFIMAADYTVNIMYFVSRSFIAFIWFVYSERTHDKAFFKSKLMYICSIPMIIDILLIISTPITRFYFYIDESGLYHRNASHYQIHQIIFLIYILIAVIKVTAKLFMKKYFSERSKYYSMFFFGLPLIAAAVLQIVNHTIPALSIGIVFSMLQMQFSSTNLLVTADELTGINNRNQLLKFLDFKMAAYAADLNNSNSLFLFIMDVDDFKGINDNFGHIEGDEALKTVANCLKKICGKYNCFCSRYGGDEFIMVGEFYDARSAEMVSIELNELIFNTNRSCGNDYELQLSVGFAQYGDATKTIPEFIDKADKMLYSVKRAKKLARM